MSQIWIEKLRNARSDAERDDILLREFRDLRREISPTRAARLRDDIEEQMRALLALAIPR